jgi:nicotinamide riboside kinase
LANKRPIFPIIHIIGLPGSGKTTLAAQLSRKLKLPIFRIGAYRSKFSLSPIGEADAWVALFKDLSRCKWSNCILETTGLNQRESFLGMAFPLSQMVTIKLNARQKSLYERIGKKSKNEQGGEWLFSADYPDKYKFVGKLYEKFKKLPADIQIDTTRLTAGRVYCAALLKLEPYKMLGSRQG